MRNTSALLIAGSMWLVAIGLFGILLALKLA